MKRNNKILIFSPHTVQLNRPSSFVLENIFCTTIFSPFSIYMGTLLLNYIALSYFHYFQPVLFLCGCDELIKM
jgi:hypothetical protein